jgi:hypothetical protein
MLAAAPVLGLVACVSLTASVVEAEKFILRDKNSKDRAEIAMTYDFGPKGNPSFDCSMRTGKNSQPSVPASPRFRAIREKPCLS